MSLGFGLQNLGFSPTLQLNQEDLYVCLLMRPLTSSLTRFEVPIPYQPLVVGFAPYHQHYHVKHVEEATLEGDFVSNLPPHLINGIEGT